MLTQYFSNTKRYIDKTILNQYFSNTIPMQKAMKNNLKPRRFQNFSNPKSNMPPYCSPLPPSFQCTHGVPSATYT